MSHYEKQISTQEVFKGRILSVRHDTVMLENGREALREVACHPGAVVVLAAHEGWGYFVRQYRYSVGHELLEVPAGKLEPGEDHRSAAIRELREETGAECQSLVYLGETYPSPGAYNEVFHMYFAGELTFGEQDPDEDEFLTVERIKISDFFDMIARGEIHDCKSICITAMARARGLI